MPDFVVYALMLAGAVAAMLLTMRVQRNAARRQRGRETPRGGRRK